MLVLLMSQATNGLGGTSWERAKEEDKSSSVDESLTSVEGVLNDWNPEMMGPEGEGNMVFARPYQVGMDRTSTQRKASAGTQEEVGDGIQKQQSIPKRKGYESELSDHQSSSSDSPILSTQRRLASITEMIHVASLLHDDVIDASPLRRGAPSAPQQFSDKLSVLAGDFLLGRASVALARLGSNEVVELLATVIANLVEGEVIQLRASPTNSKEQKENKPSEEAFEMYMRKTYLKTASLMAKSARAAVILGGCGEGSSDGKIAEGEWVKDVAYGYGRNLGIAFQVSETLNAR